MTKAERLRGVLHGETPDRIPWAMYPSYLIYGAVELAMRNDDLALYTPAPVHRMRTRDIQMTDVLTADVKRRMKACRRTYHTPKGDLTGVLGFGFQNAFHSFAADSKLSQPGLVPDEGVWPIEHFFKDEKDYDILECIFENTFYEPCYEPYLQAEKIMGGEGIALAMVWKTPFQTLIYDWMGLEKCYEECFARPDRFQHLIDVLSRKQREMFEVIAKSPAQEVWLGENLTIDITSPPFFEQYCLPFYKDISAMMHESGKLFGGHLDGTLKGLEGYIAEAHLDFIDAFTPPPGGGLPLADARRMWPDKVILCNFPSAVFFEGPEATEKFTLGLLQDVAPGDKFVMATTESFPLEVWRDGFQALGKVMREYGAYPIRKAA